MLSGQRTRLATQDRGFWRCGATKPAYAGWVQATLDALYEYRWQPAL